MDFTSLLKKALPWIGAAATGNVPALIGMAAKEVADAIGVDVAPTAEAVAKAVAGATPEQMLALRDREMAFKERMTAMGFQHERELADIGLKTETLYVTDTHAARLAHASDRGVYWLGIAVLVTFFVVMLLALVGSYKILSGGITVKDVGIVAAVFGFLGTIVGYVAANAQQVVSYFFGSSRGSNDKSREMAEAVKRLGTV